MTYEPKNSLHWLGHASFRIEGNGLVIYLDPWEIRNPVKADLILITHDHFDHCSPEDVRKISKPDTRIITVKPAAQKLGGKVHIVQTGETLQTRDIQIETIPAYNINKFRSPGHPFHPKNAGYAGFILTIDEERIYHAGDTDLIPEMKGLSVDIALLPVSGIYVMTAKEAAQAAETIRPKLAIPMHIGKGIGEMNNASRFAELAGIPVSILPIE